MKTTLRRALGACLLAPALAAAVPALADDAPAGTTQSGGKWPEGKWQVKVLATAVLANGKIGAVESIDPSLAALAPFAAPQTFASNNPFTPTLAVEYFFTKNISVETIAGITAHHVNGRDSLDGTNLVNHILIVPATVTVKYHLPLGPIRPYVGVGPTWFIVTGGRPGDTSSALGVTRNTLTSNPGIATQAGVDIPIGKTPFSLALDAKKYWVDTKVRFFAGSADVLTTRLKLDPWVLSAGVGYRF